VYNNNITCLFVSGTKLYAGSPDGVYVSSNNGTSWTRLVDLNIISLTVSETNIYGGTTHGLYSSTDSGKSWAFAGLNSNTITSLAAIGSYIFAGTDIFGVYVSSNNGSSWTQVNNNLSCVFITSLCAIGTNLFAGTVNGGAFLSTDYGTNWTQVINGMTNAYVKDIHVSGTNIFAATSGTGMFLSTNNGTNWTPVNNGLSNPMIYSLAANGTNIFAGMSNGVYLSTNNGTNWSQVNNGMTFNDVVSLAANGNNILAGEYFNHMFLSTNNGSIWTYLYNSPSGHIWSLAINGNNIYAGLLYGGVYLSTNNGTDWIQDGLYTIDVYSFTFNGTGVFAGTSGGVYYSTNNGSNWTLVNNGLTDTKIYSLLCVGNYVFAGSGNGSVFLTTNNGANWTNVKNGLPRKSIYSLTLSGTNILAGTYGGGVWSRPLSEMISPNSILYPKLTLSTGSINAGQSIIITGSDFTNNGKVRLNISGPDGFQQNNLLTSNNNGGFNTSFITNAAMQPGVYNILAVDSISGYSAPIRQFQLLNNSATSYLNITYPVQNSSFYTNNNISIEWQDKMVPGSNYPLNGSKRNYKYIVEYSVNGGSYQNIATVQGQAYINSVVNLNCALMVSSPSGNVVVRVKDGYDASNLKVSFPFSVLSSLPGNIKVTLKWDYSFPNPGVPCLGVAADGISRIYLELSKITSTGPDISNVSVQLSDGINSESTKLGKVKAADNTTSYSSEANGITSINATDISSKTIYTFWYVSPDDFIGGNTSDTSSSFRFVNANFTVNYAGGSSETFTKSIKIVRPPVMLVHGLAGRSSSFDNFQTTNYGKIIYDSRFLSKRAITLSPNAAFNVNALSLCPTVVFPSKPNFYNTFQGLIYDIRSKGYAANQVDYVGHSMGGSVLRSVLDNFYPQFTRTGAAFGAEYKNYESGYTHKVITIGTPHNASPWADVLNRYIGDLPLTARILIMSWYGLYSNENSLPLAFIQPVDPNAFFWTYTVTDAVSNLQINGGVKFNASNIKAHLIAGDFFPGTQISFPQLLPQTAIDYVKNVGNETLEQLLTYLLKVASVKELDPKLKEAFLSILTSNVDPLSKALDFLDKAAMTMDIANMVTFLPESDLIVHITSQLADNDKAAPNVSVFDNWVGHTVIRAELDNMDIGNRVNFLLNAPVNSNLFSGIPGTNNKKVSSRLSPLDSSPIASIIDTNRIKLSLPSGAGSVPVDSTINVLVNVKDTTNLRSLNLYFQNKEYSVNNFQQGLNNVSIGVNSQLDSQDLEIEGFYIYPDSGVFVYDQTTVQVTTSGSLISFTSDQPVMYLVKGDLAHAQHLGVYQNFAAPVSSYNPGISVSVNNPSIVQYDDNSKSFKAVSQGETYAITTYHGISDTVYFVIYDMNTDSVQSVIKGTTLSAKDYQIYQNYPNPFNSTTTIKYIIPQTSFVKIKVYDILGREVKSLVNEIQEPGNYKIDFDGSRLCSGVYFYSLKAGNFYQAKKIVLLK
jgi:photosystem II stability/assembly factor-like uncharacterized protein/pimeloyl-ACP methyl ester carboxylesterase